MIYIHFLFFFLLFPLSPMLIKASAVEFTEKDLHTLIEQITQTPMHTLNYASDLKIWHDAIMQYAPTHDAYENVEQTVIQELIKKPLIALHCSHNSLDKAQLFNNPSTRLVQALYIYDNYLCAGSSDGSVILWNPDTHQQHKTMQLEGITNNAINCISQYQNNQICIASENGTIILWHINKQKSIVLQSKKHNPKPAVNCLAAQDNILFAGCADGTVKEWDAEKNICTATRTPSQWSINSLIVNDKTVYGASTDNSIIEWHTDEYNRSKITLKGHDGGVNCLAMRNDHQLISGSSDKTIKIWDIRKHQSPYTLYGHDNKVRALCSYNNLLFSGADDRIIKIWDPEHGEQIDEITTHSPHYDLVVHNNYLYFCDRDSNRYHADNSYHIKAISLPDYPTDKIDVCGAYLLYHIYHHVHDKKKIDFSRHAYLYNEAYSKKLPLAVKDLVHDYVIHLGPTILEKKVSEDMQALKEFATNLYISTQNTVAYGKSLINNLFDRAE